MYKLSVFELSYSENFNEYGRILFKNLSLTLNNNEILTSLN